MANDGLLADFRRALPDFTDQDNVGSPIVSSLRGRLVPGRSRGAGHCPREAGRAGMRLILDFVPNHVAPTIRGCTNTLRTLSRGMIRT